MKNEIFQTLIDTVFTILMFFLFEWLVEKYITTTGSYLIAFFLLYLTSAIMNFLADYIENHKKDKKNMS